MSTTSYWIGINTGTDYKPGDYDDAAGTLVNLLASLLSDNKVITQITHAAHVDGAVADIEVGMEATPMGRELVCKAVLDVTAPERVQLDKAKLSKLIKSHPDAELWPHMSVTKKRVPRQEDFELLTA